MHVELPGTQTVVRVLRTAPGGRLLVDAGSSGLGSHMLGLLEDCEQLFAYLQVLGVDLEGARLELIRGGLLHVGMAHIYGRRGAKQRGGTLVNGERITDPDQLYEPLAAVEYSAGASDAPGLASQVLGDVLTKIERYERWSRAVDTFEVEAVEHPVRFDFQGDPLTARLDLVIRHGAHKVVWDHKGTYQVDRVHTLYSNSLQILTLRHAGETFWRSRDVTINYVNWGKGEKSRTEFERRQVQDAPAMQARLPLRVRQNWHHLRTLWKHVDPTRWPQRGACVDKWGKECPALRLCREGYVPASEAHMAPNPKLMEELALTPRLGK